MKTSFLTTALQGALVTALPTTLLTIPTILEPIEIRAPALLEVRADGRAATIYKSANLSGESTFIPANNYCTNIDNIFGGFDGKIKSLGVEKGSKCDFYQESGCGLNDLNGGGVVLEVGFRNKKDERRQLGSWEGRIKSVYCQRL
ncbi:hypothetical protein BU25DRAFT_478499 [Macroventuria anomochaeta]|uniref:Uncharacterized protein n=1 Tax=Macroventuria anomochaeta TaxID=301207 RepID=A0ACB6RMM0_9PLEO|nr:uncharacterized protein BU25DRAFT_478499 [Macroventuria anomochaeta]KAF2623271.1 hypothetical protein BU25DRAFT_478499 [Macroventuria anomochaeta]